MANSFWATLVPSSTVIDLVPIDPYFYRQMMEQAVSLACWEAWNDG